MNKLNIVKLSVDDWQALYINGVLKFQNHSIDHKLIELLTDYINEPIIIESIKDLYFDDNLEEYNYNFPNKLIDFKLYNN